MALHLFMNLLAFKGGLLFPRKSHHFHYKLRGGLSASGVSLISSTTNCLGKWWPAVGTMLRLLALLILVKQLMNLVEQHTNCICKPHHVVQ